MGERIIGVGSSSRLVLLERGEVFFDKKGEGDLSFWERGFKKKNISIKKEKYIKRVLRIRNQEQKKDR